METHCDESRVGAFDLPELLVARDGRRVETAGEWASRRRPEILELFRTQMYGVTPVLNAAVGTVQHEELAILDDAAHAVQRTVRLRTSAGAVDVDFLVVLPVTAAVRLCPVVLGLNFGGNHTVTGDPKVWLPRSPVPTQFGGEDGHATEESRGRGVSRWPLDLIVGRGFGLATAYAGDIDPDFDDGFSNGVHALSDEPRTPESWGTIAAWAWGLSRLLDVLGDIPGVENDRVSLIGHSRLGKAALWAGAQDERFAAVLSNESGCGGAALTRREYGETIEAITTVFPHWFCSRFATYAGRAGELPVDQHMLVSLFAPRPVYLGSAFLDQWSDPKGEYLSAHHAGPAFELFGHRVPPDADPPEVGREVGDRVRYHCRPGPHDLRRDDWERYLDFLLEELS